MVPSKDQLPLVVPVFWLMVMEPPLKSLESASVTAASSKSATLLAPPPAVTDELSLSTFVIAGASFTAVSDTVDVRFGLAVLALEPLSVMPVIVTTRLAPTDGLLLLFW